MAHTRAWPIAALAAAACLSSGAGSADDSDVSTDRGIYTPHPSILEARQWFQDAKLGIFIHWGIYSVLADGEWVMNLQKIPIYRCERLAELFQPTRFDADEWVRAFQSAGARYVTVTAKHHDGFAMYDSAVSDYDIVDRTPGGKAGFNTIHVARMPKELAETMNGSWGFNLQDDDFKSTRELLRMLVGAAGRDSNLLLNTGPMPNGRLQPENVATYREIGEWLEVYGEAIYGTRGGPVAPSDWGVTTQNGKAVYLHIMDLADGELILDIDDSFTSASLLRDGRPVALHREPGGIRLRVPSAGPDEWNRVIKLAR